jgi:hypothetical protein
VYTVAQAEASVKRRPQDTWEFNRHAQGLKEIREARAKADAERKRMLKRYRDHQLAAERERQARATVLEAKRKRFAELALNEALVAARRLTFVDLEAERKGAPTPLNRPSLTLVELFVRVLKERNSVVVLQWPRGIRDISILHPLATLGLLGSAPEQVADGYHWCRPVPDFRTLHYPWRGSGTGVVQRRVLVDRTEVTRRNQLHLTRDRVNQPELSPELGHLHLTIGHLNQLKLRDATKPHLAHPTLAELYPTFGALGGEAHAPFSRPVYEIFGRVRHGAALDRLQDHREDLSQPATAPFAFFGVCPRSDVKRALQHPTLTEARSPDVCLLDLCSPGLNRLGPGWEKAVETFLALLAAYLPETPVLAVTQDIYVHRRCGYLLAAAGLAPRPTLGDGRASRVLVRSSDECFMPDPDIGEVTDVQFRFRSAGGQGAAALRALSEAARDSSDPVVSGILRHTMGNLRRSMSLPCGLRVAHDTLVETADGFLEYRSAGTVLATIRKQLELSVDGAERERLANAERMIDAAFDEFENDTPVGSLLAESAAGMARKSSPSVIAFATDHELALGKARICTDDDDGRRIQARLDSGFIRLTTLQALDVELGHIESGRSRNSWKRLLVVAPPRAQFAILLGRTWLPEEIIVLSDREFVDRLAGTYAVLATHPDLTGAGRIGSRLAKAAAAAKAEAKARDVPALDLELEARAPSITDERVIDLTVGEQEEDERDIVEFGLESGRTMRVRPGGLVIRHDRFADVNPFERALARDVTAGNTIVVPNQAFVQEARTVLPVRILTQTRVQVYHAAVEAALQGIPGTTRSAKARQVMERLRSVGARAVVEATVLDWLNVAEHKQAPPERLRPHAPQHWREFRAFMDVIHVPPALAEAIWREGIEPLRIDRRRAGARMAQAFISVLVDPHGGAGALSPDVKERIAQLRRQAMEHLDGVLTVRRQDAHPDMHA